MASPDISKLIDDEQRRKNIALAMEARKERATVKARVASGEIGVADVLAMDSKAVRRMTVISLLAARKGCSKRGALRLMQSIGISEERRVGGLGSRQRERLLDAIGDGK